MFRKVVASLVVIGATLVAVPSVLAALQSPSAFGSSFRHGNVVTRGWASPQAIDAGRMRMGVPVRQTLTIANEGSLAATYRLRARITGDRAFASHLVVVATRRSDGATIYSGSATGLRSIDLGRFGAGAQETLQLRVTLMPTGTQAGDNALQGRGASVDFSWTATQA